MQPILTWKKLVNREDCSTHAPMKSIIQDTFLFTKSVGNEGLPELNKFVHETLHNAVHLVAHDSKTVGHAIIR